MDSDAKIATPTVDSSSFTRLLPLNRKQRRSRLQGKKLRIPINVAVAQLRYERGIRRLTNSVRYSELCTMRPVDIIRAGL